MISVKEKLQYGVDENIDKRYLYVDKIKLVNYHHPNEVENVMLLLSDKGKFYQYNFEGKAKDSDYFFWQYVDDKGEKNWQSVDISVYQNSIDYDYKMRKLIDFIKFNICGIDLEIIVEYNDVRKLIQKIDHDIEFENEFKKEV